MTSKKEHRKLSIVSDLRVGDFVELATFGDFFENKVGVIISVGIPTRCYVKIVVLASEKVLTWDVFNADELTPKELELNDA